MNNALAMNTSAHAGTYIADDVSISTDSCEQPAHVSGYVISISGLLRTFLNA